MDIHGRRGIGGRIAAPLRRLSVLLFVFALGNAWPPAGAAEPKSSQTELTLPWTFEVPSARQGSGLPVSVTLPGLPSEGKAVRVREVTSGSEGPVVSQIETGSSPRLWLLLPQPADSNAVRRFRLEAGDSPASPLVALDRQAAYVEVRCGDAKVLRYNTAHVEPPAGVNPKYGRSAHIHPVWTPSGKVVTDEFPPDHLHQSGIFLAFTKTRFKGHDVNFWDLLGGQGRVRFRDLKSLTSGPVFGEFQVEHEHVDQTVPEGEVALRETWNVRVWNVGGTAEGYRVVDLKSTVRCAGEEPLQLPKYHYGGMAVRGARGWTPEHSQFVTSEGKGRQDGNHTQPHWCDLFGDVDGQTAGISLLTHPKNFRFPEPLRIHPTMPYMVYCASQLGDWEIVPGKPHVARYRWVVHDGAWKTERFQPFWTAFAEWDW